MGIFINIILIIAIIAVFIVSGIVKEYNERYNENERKFRFNKKQFLTLIPIALLVLSFSIVVIPANTVGVRYSSINGTSDKTLNEGIHFVVPFVDHVYTIETTVQERTDEGISIQTKDAQWVKVTVNVKYHVDKSNAFKVYKGYKTLDNLNKNIIGNYTQEALNQVCTQYNVIDVLGEKRNAFVEETAKILKEKLAAEGVTLKAVTVKDIDAGEAIEKAISDEAVAKKEVETAKQKQEKAKTEAETKVIEAQGEADANAVLTEQLTPEVLEKMLIEKWNGEMPKVYGSDGNILDISSLLGE